MKKQMFIKAFLASLIVLLSGCSLSSGKAIDGGIWKSTDAGKSWQQVNDILATKGKILSLGLVEINKIIFDPQDSKTIYLATENNGVFYSLDAGVSWQNFSQLPKTTFNDVAVNPKNKCIIYAVSGNKLFKTENCGRDFSNIYYHQKDQVILNAIAVDFYDPQIVYLGTSEGELLKSTDGGRAWQTSYRAGSAIIDLLIDPADSRIIYAGTQRNGLFKTVNSGAVWTEINTGIKSYSGANEYRRLLVDPATVGGLIFVSKAGIFRSYNRGVSWKSIELLPSQKAINITAAGVNPQNSNEFYYTTASTLVKTTDAGNTWSSIKLPHTQTTSFFVIARDGSVYLSTKKSKNK